MKKVISVMKKVMLIRSTRFQERCALDGIYIVRAIIGDEVLNEKVYIK